MFGVPGGISVNTCLFVKANVSMINSQQDLHISSFQNINKKSHQFSVS